MKMEEEEVNATKMEIEQDSVNVNISIQMLIEKANKQNNSAQISKLSKKETIDWWKVPTKNDTEIMLKIQIPKRIMNLEKIIAKYKNLKQNIFFSECKVDMNLIQTIWNELKYELIFGEKVFSYLGTFTSGLMAALQNKLSRSTEIQCILMRDTSNYREILKEYIDQSESMYQDIGEVKKEIKNYPNVEDYKSSLDLEVRTKIYMMLDKFDYCRNRLLYTRKLFLKNWELLIHESPDEEEIGLFN